MAQSHPSAFIEEVADESQPQPDSSGDEADDVAVEDALAPGTSSKKKKKKKSKAAKALSAFQMKASISQPLVDEVLKRVQAEVGPSHPEANEQTVREALKQLKVKDYLEGKDGLGGKNKKDMGDYKVSRSTQLASAYTDPSECTVLGHPTRLETWCASRTMTSL